MARDLPLPTGDVDDVSLQHSVMSHAQRIIHPYINAPLYDSLGNQEVREVTTYVIDGGQADTTYETSDWIDAGDLLDGDN